MDGQTQADGDAGTGASKGRVKEPQSLANAEMHAATSLRAQRTARTLVIKPIYDLIRRSLNEAASTIALADLSRHMNCLMCWTPITSDTSWHQRTQRRRRASIFDSRSQRRNRLAAMPHDRDAVTVGAPGSRSIGV